MKLTSKIKLGLKALTQLGPTKVGLYGLYQLGLRTGHYHRTLDAALARLSALNRPEFYRLQPCLHLPDRKSLMELLGDSTKLLYEEADEIIEGRVRLFGAQPVPLVLNPLPLDAYWTKYEGNNNQPGGQDIKYIWEPARFGWAYTLARAYYLSGDEKYTDTFWDYADRFFTSNTPYFGPHWSSAQEVAIRLVALAFAYQVFTFSTHTTPERANKLALAIAIHAERIPLTMVYARSQNNNHLITEALGLYTASAILPDHPFSAKWHRLGWKWLLIAYRTQITADGTYVQHSTNYHRLMLQAALWLHAVHQYAFAEEGMPPKISAHLADSTTWLWQVMDPVSGRVPNLGHNDGAYILPLTVCPYQDYRPVVYSATQAFLHLQLAPTGPWCEMALWLCDPSEKALDTPGVDFWNIGGHPIQVDAGPIHGQHNPKNTSWAFIRASSFSSRPAHVDQLHVDLWWHGLNLARDPGTYLYNSAPPWDNSLASALVHNTITIDSQEFMQRTNRFLYLDWAQAKTSISNRHPNSYLSITATHNGYRKIGLAHLRTLTALLDGNWEIIDQVTGSTMCSHTFRLHWLLPDWEYQIIESPDRAQSFWYKMRIHSPFGWITLDIGELSNRNNTRSPRSVNFQLVRAGQLLYGAGEVNPICGWYSPTYGQKIAALACIFEVTATVPVEIRSFWILPNEA